MRRLLERLGGFVPVAVALAVPSVFIPTISSLPSAVDSFILPRASIVIAGACVGTGLALLTPRRPALGALRWPLVAAAGAALLAFAFSVSWPLSFAGSYTRYESLPMRLSYLGLLASAVWLIRGRLAREAVVPAFVLGVNVVSLIAVGQWLSGVNIASLIAEGQWLSNEPFRPDGNLGNANLLAALIAMALPLAVARGIRGGYFVAAWWVGVAVLVLGLLVSTSRSGGLGAMAGCLALAAFLVRRRFSARTGLVAGVGVTAAAVIGVAVTAIAVSPLSRLNDDPPSLRLHLWQDGIRMVLARPLTGWGEDTTGLAFGQFLSHNYAELVTFDRIHSGPLDIAATEGVIGLAALAWVLAVLFHGAWHSRFPGDVAGLTAALVGYSAWVVFNFDWAPATGAFWLLAGTAWSGVRLAESVPPPMVDGSRAAPRVGWRRSGIAVGAGIAAVVLAAMPMLADVWYYEGRADLSVRVDPLQARYHWSLGDALIGQGSLAKGADELRLAADFGETEPGLYVDLGDAEVRLGNITQARADYRRALVIDPYYTPASQRLANLKS
jgi:O-antigen ligase